MRFQPALTPARLVRRYKRFLADVKTRDGSQLTVHCPNTGAMLGCQAPGSRVWLSRSDNPRRKYPHTWELVETGDGVLVGINTARTNHLVAEALNNSVIKPLSGYTQVRREITVGRGRLDFLLSGHPRKPDCLLEVKNVTAAVTSGVALFPDAPSERARRHLLSLAEQRASGLRAAVVFCVQREDANTVRPASEIDPQFSEALAMASKQGVEIYAYGADVSQTGIEVVRRLLVKSDL